MGNGQRSAKIMGSRVFAETEIDETEIDETEIDNRFRMLGYREEEKQNA